MKNYSLKISILISLIFVLPGFIYIIHNPPKSAPHCKDLISDKEFLDSTGKNIQDYILYEYKHGDLGYFINNDTENRQPNEHRLVCGYKNKELVKTTDSEEDTTLGVEYSIQIEWQDQKDMLNQFKKEHAWLTKIHGQDTKQETNLGAISFWHSFSLSMLTSDQNYIVILVNGNTAKDTALVRMAEIIDKKL